MKVLSLFDGMSCGQIALNRIGIVPSAYYAAEIDKYAIQVTKHNYPNTMHLGSVTDWQTWNIPWGEIDLVTGGFPCQAWSVAGKQQGDKDERGMLFWVMLDIMRNVLDHNPSVKFLIENVKMKKEFEQYITHHAEQALGLVHKTLINSALVSAQNRQRYYWTNFEVTQPEDKGIVLADIIESGCCDRDKSLTVTTRVAGATEKRYLEKSIHQMIVDRDKAHCLDANYFKGGNLKSYFEKNRRQLVFCGAIRGRYNSEGKTEQQLETRGDEKTNSLTTVQKDNVIIDNLSNLTYRKLSPLECERLQTVPDNYTAVVSNSQRYKMLGNGWTVDVIAHILQHANLDPH
jgi:DNA (cytosine-5)-methyltransferase 1/DNA (cytosine-5)-methyltransferase 3A